MPRWILLIALCALGSLCGTAVAHAETALAVEVHEVAPSESETSDEETVASATGSSDVGAAADSEVVAWAAVPVLERDPPTRPPRA